MQSSKILPEFWGWADSACNLDHFENHKNLKTINLQVKIFSFIRFQLSWMPLFSLPFYLGGLKLFKCGVKNCGKSFAAQSEKSLLAHMETTHGAYYIKVFTYIGFRVATKVFKGFGEARFKVFIIL